MLTHALLCFLVLWPALRRQHSVRSKISTMSKLFLGQTVPVDAIPGSCSSLVIPEGVCQECQLLDEGEETCDCVREDFQNIGKLGQNRLTAQDFLIAKMAALASMPLRGAARKVLHDMIVALGGTVCGALPSTKVFGLSQRQRHHFGPNTHTLNNLQAQFRPDLTLCLRVVANIVETFARVPRGTCGAPPMRGICGP